MNPGESNPEVREATAGEVVEVMSILDAAMLDTSTARVRSLIEAGSDETDGAVLLAVGDGHLLGALVLDGDEIEAVAVRPRRRDQGIGTALVGAASERVDGTMCASFDADLRPFYERLGFEIEPVGEDRYRGHLE